MTIRPMTPADIPSVVALQISCFPPPFPAELLWQPDHLAEHLEVYPEGQFVAEAQGQIVGSASALVIGEEVWQAHLSWDETTGGPFFERHDPGGTTLFGADISVHPAWRGQGIGRALYGARYDLVRSAALDRYGTACRLPGFAAWTSDTGGDVRAYAQQVAEGITSDRTMTPLIRYGLALVTVIENHMEDAESGNAAAALEWRP